MGVIRRVGDRVGVVLAGMALAIAYMRAVTGDWRDAGAWWLLGLCIYEVALLRRSLRAYDYADNATVDVLVAALTDSERDAVRYYRAAIAWRDRAFESEILWDDESIGGLQGYPSLDERRATESVLSILDSDGGAQ